MAKFLDGGGLTYLWSKIKSYLTTWKSENFGSGTIKVSADTTLYVSENYNERLSSGEGLYYIRKPFGIIVSKTGGKDSSNNFSAAFKNETGAGILLLIIYGVYESVKVNEVKIEVKYLSDADYTYIDATVSYSGPFLAIWCNGKIGSAES